MRGSEDEHLDEALADGAVGGVEEGEAGVAAEGGRGLRQAGDDGPEGVRGGRCRVWLPHREHLVMLRYAAIRKSLIGCRLRDKERIA